MPILPLPQFEADLEADRKLYEQLKPPTSIVVRFGIMKLIGEFPYSGDAKPGCGSKLVVRTHRGTELGEMLTSTCPNSGCSKAITRKQMLEYIENSGGKDYPFFNQGRVLRIATIDDLNQQAKIDADRPKLVMEARRHVGELNLPMKVVDAEPILGGERLTFYFTSEDRVDFRDLVTRLAATHQTRIEMRQVGARDEARLTADYERCGQHCCCKQFLKVLKPVSMRSAKVQKATLDPLKISGRCGRLMCCLRYEDQTYEELRKRLPRKKTRVLTSGGWGIVIDSQILTQLVLVKLEDSDAEIAVPVEELQTGAQAAAAAPPPRDDDDIDGDDGAPAQATTAHPPRPAQQPRPQRQERPQRGAPPQQQPRGDRPRPQGQPGPRQDRPQQEGRRPEPQRQQQPRPDSPRAPASQQQQQPRGPGQGQAQGGPPQGSRPPGDGQRKRRRRRRGRGGQGGPGASGGPSGPTGGPEGGPPASPPPPPAA